MILKSVEIRLLFSVSEINSQSNDEETSNFRTYEKNWNVNTFNGHFEMY